MNRSNKLLLVPLFWLIAALVFSQSAAAIHSAEHPFHEHSIECEIYTLVQNDGETAIVYAALGSFFVSQSSLILNQQSNHFSAQNLLGLRIRAPPTISF